MIIELKSNERVLLYPFFSKRGNTFVHSYLQGHMGRAWADSNTKPSYGLIQVGDFCILSGKNYKDIDQVLSLLPDLTNRNNILLMPGDKRIEEIIHKDYPKWDIIRRYAFEHKKAVFNIPYLKQMVAALDKEYKLYPMDEYWYSRVLKEEWSVDFVSNFESATDYLNRGLGVVITRKDEIVSGASSYSIYNGGIEIQVDTKSAFRKKGLAYIASAALIIACLERNIYPGWDAANEVSVHLARKLGYSFSHTYNVFNINK